MPDALANNSAPPSNSAPAAGGQSQPAVLNKLLDSGKFLMGTVVVALIAPILNHQYQNAQLELERAKSLHAMELQERQSKHSMQLEEKKAEFDYLSKFMDNAMKEDVRSRMRFASYMRSIALSANVQKAWLDFYKELEKEWQATQQKIDTIQDGLKEKEQKLVEVVQAERVREPVARALVKEIEVATNSLYRAQEKLDREEYGRADQRAVNIYETLVKAQDAERDGRYEEQRNLLSQALLNSPRAVHPYILTYLAFAHRSLHQFDLARKYMEQAVDLAPPSASTLFNLAIMQKNANDVPQALKTLERASEMPNVGSLRNMIELVTAGYLIHSGRREEGLKRFAVLKQQLDPSQYAINLAWFSAVAGDEGEFYRHLELALRLTPQRVLVWIDQEVDIAKFKDQKRFKDLVDQARNR